MKLILLYNKYALIKMKPCYSKEKKFTPKEKNIFHSVKRSKVLRVEAEQIRGRQVPCVPGKAREK